RWGSIVRLIDALVGDGTYGTTRTLHSGLPVGLVHDDRAQRAVRHQSKDRLQVAGSLRSGRTSRTRRSQPGAAALSAQDLRRGGHADLRGPAAAPELGAGQAPGLARSAPSDG